MIGQKLHSENPRILYCSTSMEALLGISSIPSSSSSAKTLTFKFSQDNKSNFLLSRRESIQRICRSSCNGSVSRFSFDRAEARPAGDAHKQRSNLESLFCYDKPIPEEIIEKPVGLSLGERRIGDNPRCPDCEAKGAILCMTCSGTGLYVDSILESQGIIVKVRCLGCGGTGNIMCSNCGGRGHLGV